MMNTLGKNSEGEIELQKNIACIRKEEDWYMKVCSTDSKRE